MNKTLKTIGLSLLLLTGATGAMAAGAGIEQATRAEAPQESQTTTEAPQESQEPVTAPESATVAQEEPEATTAPAQEPEASTETVESTETAQTYSEPAQPAQTRSEPVEAQQAPAQNPAPYVRKNPSAQNDCEDQGLKMTESGSCVLLEDWLTPQCGVSTDPAIVRWCDWKFPPAQEATPAPTASPEATPAPTSGNMELTPESDPTSEVPPAQ